MIGENINTERHMNQILRILLAVSCAFALSNCSWHLFGHSKNGKYMGMSGTTQAMSTNTYVPPSVQRQEPLF